MHRWVVRSLVVWSLVGLVLAGMVPHRHDGSAASHPEQACRVCRLQQAASTPPPLVVEVQAAPQAVALAALPSSESPRVVQLVASVSPRSPPVLS